MFYNDVDPKLLHQGKLLAAREARLVALEWDEATIVTMTYLQRLWGDLVNAKPELSAELTALHRKHNLGSFVTSCFVGIVFVLRADVSREWIQDATPNDIVLLAQEELSDDDSPANRAIALSVMDEEDDEDYLTDEERKDILAVFGSESIDLAGFEPAFYVGMLSTDEWCPSEEEFIGAYFDIQIWRNNDSYVVVLVETLFNNYEVHWSGEEKGKVNVLLTTEVFNTYAEAEANALEFCEILCVETVEIAAVEESS